MENTGALNTELFETDNEIASLIDNDLANSLAQPNFSKLNS